MSKLTQFNCLINAPLVICPQCRKRLDADVEDSPTLAAASMQQLEAAAACHYGELDKVRTRPGQGVEIEIETK